MGNAIHGSRADIHLGAGIVISSDATIMAVGARYYPSIDLDGDGNDDYPGQVKVYQYSSGSWTQMGGDIDGEGNQDQSSNNAIALSSDGLRLAVGGYANSNSAGSFAGHVRVYEFSSNAWSHCFHDLTIV